MIKVTPNPLSQEAHDRYESKVLLPGTRWLLGHTEGKERPKPYWREITLDLATAFHDRCAYTTIFLNFSGEVDHFVSIDEDRSEAYQWSNFRYCVGWFNSKKQHVRSAEILDPLLVEDDWFELADDLQLRVSERCPTEYRQKADFMLEKLGLRNHERLMRLRRRYWNMFLEKGPAVLEQLDHEAPLVARAARKHLAQAAQAL